MHINGSIENTNAKFIFPTDQKLAASLAVGTLVVAAGFWIVHLENLQSHSSICRFKTLFIKFKIVN